MTHWYLFIGTFFNEEDTNIPIKNIGTREKTISLKIPKKGTETNNATAIRTIVIKSRFLLFLINE